MVKDKEFPFKENEELLARIEKGKLIIENPKRGKTKRKGVLFILQLPLRVF
jgi:hypothetical protein